jgi:3-deoxy-D-manno-octulosonate 8-phosphate phosphatase (KDO 8-P phosphatase)
VASKTNEGDCKERAQNAKLLLLDVDGVLTSGFVHIFGDDTEMYTFNTYDGYGIKLWRRAGFKVGFMTGRHSDAIAHRAKKLGADFLFQDAGDKLAICKNLTKEEGLKMEEVAFMGDDLQDRALLRKVGFSVAPANARPEILEMVDYTTVCRGGEGAVRELIEVILKAKGLWAEILKQEKILS